MKGNDTQKTYKSEEDMNTVMSPSVCEVIGGVRASMRG